MPQDTLLISLVGEQAAPVLLPAYELEPDQVLLVASERTVAVAKRLEVFLQHRGFAVDVVGVDPYNPHRTYAALLKKAESFGHQELLGNFSGGTKTMALALQLLLRGFRGSGSHRLCYLQSEGPDNLLHFFDPNSLEQIGEPRRVSKCISIEDHLAVYWGRDAYEIRGLGKKNDAGHAFEREVAAALENHVEEIKVGVERPRHDVQLDLVLRCGNRMGIAELKTGSKARGMEGIKQLSTFGTRNAIGTYVKKFLILDRTLEEKDLRSLAEALGIILIELTGFGVSENRSLSDEDKQRLVAAVVKALGCKRGASCSS